MKGILNYTTTPTAVNAGINANFFSFFKACLRTSSTGEGILFLSP